tara:strand:+ start:8239 stop:9000 length:762 start_codon:yes stop_codon:yes gene_type:complete
MQDYTLTFSESVKGWPSFYSYMPDCILGMNQYLYTFKGGSLYRHNTNERRNNFYGIDYDSTLTGVFNQEPTTVKVFKTIELESDDSWDCSIVTDLGSGFMDETYFEEKEGAWFAFIRRIGGSQDFRQRSTQGIGGFLSTSGASPGIITLTFSISISSIVNYGDSVFYKDGVTLKEVGPITSISSDRKTIQADATDLLPVGSVVPSGAYIFTTKNSVAESYGATGYYMEFKLTNNNTSAVELFTVDSDVFKSFP